MLQRDHLRRLGNVWLKNPLYFITICCADHRPILTQISVPELLLQSWQDAASVHGWAIGRYVIMPDHVHFFTRAQSALKPLSAFIRDWKKWTTRGIAKATGITPPFWQSEFFDHVIRSADSHTEKWHYVLGNPVRAGLVTTAAEWPYAGEWEDLRF